MDKPYVLSRREIAMREMLYIPRGDLGEADLTPYMPHFFLAEKHAYAGPSLAILTNHALSTTPPHFRTSEEAACHVSCLHAHTRRWGQGGAYQRASVLIRKSVPVLITLQFTAWDAAVDDSMEYAPCTTARTYLLADDPVARAVFAAISEAR